MCVTLFRIWSSRSGSSFVVSSGGSCDGGRESGTWLVGVAEEVGNGGTGGRFRTGVDGVWEVAVESRARVGCV
jgi:hypothetical protein